MTATDYLAQADRYATEVRAARDCDALDPCHLCRAKAEAARSLRHRARMVFLAELASAEARFAGSAALMAQRV